MKKDTNRTKLLENHFAQLSKIVKLHHKQFCKYSSLFITVFIVLAEFPLGLQNFLERLIQLARVPNLNPILNLNKNVHSLFLNYIEFKSGLLTV